MELDPQKFLDCPVCLQLFRPPVFQCKNGHLFCKNCVVRFEKCPTCEVSIFHDVVGQIRNLAIEKIVEALFQSCPFDGCDRALLKGEVEDHKLECRFRTRKFCSLLNIPGCDLEISLDKLQEHLTVHHSKLNMCKRDGETITFGNKGFSEGPGYQIAMLWLHGTMDGEEFPFIFRVSWKDKVITWSPFMVASKEFVNRYACDIQISMCTCAPIHGPPALHCSAAVIHSLEAEGGNVESCKMDFSATMEHLGLAVSPYGMHHNWLSFLHVVQ